MAKKFNLADFLPGAANVSNLDTMEISLIPWENIRANDANFYIVDDVEDLRNSIQMHGLLDPITVTPDEEDDRYLLISGHRRFKAWGLLRQEDPERYEKIPAMIRRFESKALTELALIMANSSTRVLTPAEIGRQAERIERLFYDLKEEGYEFPGRMRDQVAAACNVSASKLARLKVIRDGLSPSFEVLWLGGVLAEATAYELARAPVWVQEKIFKASGGKAPNGSSVTGVRDAMKEGATYDGTQVAEPGCDKCNHGDAFLRHDLESYSYDHCNGKKCCLTCDNALRSWMPCQRACSVAKEKKKIMLAAQREKDEKKAAAQEKRAAKELRAKALRLVKAADASGVKDDEKVKTTWGRGISIGDLRKVANGEEVKEHVVASFLDPEQSLDARAAAKLLGCSMDYLYGMTDELKPSGSFEWKAPAHECEPPEVEAELAMTEVVSESDTGEMGFTAALESPIPVQTLAQIGLVNWMTGDPAFLGRFLCTVTTEDGITLEQTCDWRDGRWLCYGRELDGMFTVRYWWPMPPKFEHWMLRDEIAEEEG